MFNIVKILCAGLLLILSVNKVQLKESKIQKRSTPECNPPCSTSEVCRSDYSQCLSRTFSICEKWATYCKSENDATITSEQMDLGMDAPDIIDTMDLGDSGVIFRKVMTDIDLDDDDELDMSGGMDNNGMILDQIILGVEEDVAPLVPSVVDGLSQGNLLKGNGNSGYGSSMKILSGFAKSPVDGITNMMSELVDAIEEDGSLDPKKTESIKIVFGDVVPPEAGKMLSDWIDEDPKSDDESAAEQIQSLGSSMTNSLLNNKFEKDPVQNFISNRMRKNSEKFNGVFNKFMKSLEEPTDPMSLFKSLIPGYADDSQPSLLGKLFGLTPSSSAKLPKLDKSQTEMLKETIDNFGLAISKFKEANTVKLEPFKVTMTPGEMNTELKNIIGSFGDAINKFNEGNQENPALLKVTVTPEKITNQFKGIMKQLNGAINKLKTVTTSKPNLFKPLANPPKFQKQFENMINNLDATVNKIKSNNQQNKPFDEFKFGYESATEGLKVVAEKFNEQIDKFNQKTENLDLPFRPTKIPIQTNNFGEHLTESFKKIKDDFEKLHVTSEWLFGTKKEDTQDQDPEEEDDEEDGPLYEYTGYVDNETETEEDCTMRVYWNKGKESLHRVLQNPFFVLTILCVTIFITMVTISAWINEIKMRKKMKMHTEGHVFKISNNEDIVQVMHHDNTVQGEKIDIPYNKLLT